MANFAIRIASLLTFVFVFSVAVYASNNGDGIFTPTISIVAPIDKTDRPMTVDLPLAEPSFTGTIAAGKPAGDSYIIHFPSGDVGGDCVYTGNARYIIESSGALKYQILADCGKLHHGYEYIICMLNENLRCGEAPWWNFRGETYTITDEGVSVNHGTVIPWKDSADAPAKLEKRAASIKRMHDEFAHANTLSAIRCREFKPESKSFMLHDLPLGCLIQSVCSGMPNTDSLEDGEIIDWNSAAGNYAKQQLHVSGFDNWVCWMKRP